MAILIIAIGAGAFVERGWKLDESAFSKANFPAARLVVEGEGATAQEWMSVTLRRRLADGATQRVRLLRSRRWVADQAIRVGKSVELASSERSLRGRFVVEHVAAQRLLSNTRDRESSQMVTGLFVTENSETLTLRLADGHEVRGTKGHPLFSEDRGDWVGLGEVRTGERLRTLQGTAVVSDVSTHSQSEPVHNIEVHGAHQYFAGHSALWSHNNDARNGCSEVPSMGAAPTPEQFLIETSLLPKQQIEWSMSQHVGGYLVVARGLFDRRTRMLGVDSLYTHNAPPGTGTAVVQGALRKFSESNISGVVVHNIVEKNTLASLRDGGDPARSLWGRLVGTAARRELDVLDLVYHPVNTDRRGPNLRVDFHMVDSSPAEWDLH